MSSKRKKDSVTENWIRTETIDEYKKSANKALEKVKKYESEHKFKPVRIDAKTIVLKRIS